MPEGDTLRRAAEQITPVLEGEALTEVWFRKIRGHRPRIGDVVTTVDAVGKYLVIGFDRGLALHTHLGMAGSWRATAIEKPPPKSPRLRIVLATAKGRALCFAAPTIQTYIDTDTTPLDRLGPDLSEDGTDLDTVFARSRAVSPATTLAEVLLDQHVAAGVGNVFKSEALFIARLYPFRTIADVGDDDLNRLWSTAHDLLVANRSAPYRSTTSRLQRSRYYVYGRFRKACLRCHNSVLFSAAGAKTERSTYWCPTCQP